MALFPVVETPRLLLRRFTQDDLENVFRGLSHPEVIKYYGISFETLEAAKEQMEWFSNLERTGTGIWWAVCSPDGGTFYGAAGLNNIEKQHRRTEIGFWLMPEFWGRNIMAEAGMYIYDHAFHTLRLHRIEGYVDYRNHACKRLFEKLGFRHEGTMKDCEFKNGEYISLDIYSKINPM